MGVRSLLLAVAAAAVLPLVAGAAPPYRLGGIFSITGGGSPLGEPAARTARMLVEEVNSAGGIAGRRVELVLVDDQGQPDKAQAAARGLVERDRVSVIVGPSLSGTSLAVKAYTEPRGVPVVSCAASSAIVEPPEGSRWTFKTAPDNRLVARRLAGHLRQRGVVRVGILAAADAFGRDGAAQFGASARAAGLAVEYRGFYGLGGPLVPISLPGDAFSALREADVQGLVIWGATSDSAAVARAVRQAALPVALYFSHGVASRRFLELAAGAAEGGALPAGKILVGDQLGPGDEQAEVVGEYARRYRRRFGQEPSAFGGHAFDAVTLALRALREVGPGRDEIRDFLEGVQEYRGVSGVFRYSPRDHAGLRPESLVMVRIRDDRWVLEP